MTEIGLVLAFVSLACGMGAIVSVVAGIVPKDI